MHVTTHQANTNAIFADMGHGLVDTKSLIDLFEKYNNVAYYMGGGGGKGAGGSAGSTKCCATGTCDNVTT